MHSAACLQAAGCQGVRVLKKPAAVNQALMLRREAVLGLQTRRMSETAAGSRRGTGAGGANARTALVSTSPLRRTCSLHFRSATVSEAAADTTVVLPRRLRTKSCMASTGRRAQRGWDLK